MLWRVMRVRQARLVVGEAQGGWRPCVINQTFTSPTGQTEAYLGEGLVADAPSVGHVLEFRFDAALTRTALLSIPLLVSTDTVCRIYVQGTLAASAALAAAPSEITRHDVVADITQWSEKETPVPIRVMFTYVREPGTVSLLTSVDETKLSPHVRQELRIGTTLPAFTFLACAWGTILAVALWAIANMGTLSETFRVYAVVVTTGGWLATVAGVPALGSLPIAATLRRIYAFFRRYRAASLAILIVLFAVTSVAAAVVVRALGTRYAYTRLVTRALTELPEPRRHTLAAAFALLPWRPEAPALFERQLFEMRGQGNESTFRTYVKDFTRDSDVERAITRATIDPAIDRALDSDSAVLIDPVLWYSQLEPEGETDDKSSLERAVRRLDATVARDVTLRTRVLRDSLHLQDLTETGSASSRQQARARLITFVKENEIALRRSHEYQVAQDTIAASFVHDCLYDEATRWYQLLLDARLAIVETGLEVPWMRPPHKLLIYHLFMDAAGQASSDEDIAGRLGRTECPRIGPYSDAFEKDVLANPKHQRFKAPATWLSKTIFELPLERMLDDSLRHGWRY
jgi:hypothetical protein